MDAPSPVIDNEMKLVVAAKNVTAEGVVSMRLRRCDGEPVAVWDPGAHIDLVLREDLIRQYSLCGDPADLSSYEVSVLHEVDGRGGSEHVHRSLAEGDEVLVRGPRNNFELVNAQRYVFIAGGIGITPIIPMVRAVAARGADWNLIYGGRTRATMAYREQLQQSYPGRVDVRPQDETGLLDVAAIVGELAGVEDAVVYCCGPEPLLVAVEEACGASGVPLHVERFAPKPDAFDGPEKPFELELARTGCTLMVPADVSIIEVLEEAGVEVPTSCEEGMCGTCRTTVIAGVPDHRDSVLSNEERAAGRCMTVCVSRSLTPRLVLDL